MKDLAPRLQSAVDEVVEWTASKNLTIAPDKSHVTVFTSNTHESFFRTEVSLPNPDDPSGATMLKLNRRPEILGVILNTHLTFSPHIKAVAAKGRAKLNIMRALTGTSWGSSKETLLHLYKSYIHPTLEYAAPVWFPNASPSAVELLQSVQNEALRIATGNIKLSSIDHLHRECKILPIDDHLEMILSQYLASTLRPDHPSHAIMTAPEGPRVIWKTLYTRCIQHVAPYLTNGVLDPANY